MPVNVHLGDEGCNGIVDRLAKTWGRPQPQIVGTGVVRCKYVIQSLKTYVDHHLKKGSQDDR